MSEEALQDVFNLYASKKPEGLGFGLPLARKIIETEHRGSVRLASKAGFPGCYDGFVTQLADEWLGSLDAAAKLEVEVFACGPTPMLEAMAKVAVKHGVACQVSLEEFMACAVGGCAGCTVRVNTPDGPAMKRVCVDGPVFDSRAVFS